ncbi:DUF4062 domain-containing protein [Bradyrhizobium sp.]|uniref:DUF4062 domain-containing protein n=1 Tax=Bradyrhizobium sp. TaxID=376 RepID=UPI001E02C3D7|nr:DUF4062 domain-containing protein [Bradyrhizobium sp.]MBI5319812.1 DUF4062 domain-containing protein [Bradyrhizobium sp.]
MDKVYQVFVSSTFADLEEERRKVSDTLAKAGFIPAGMELFPATSLQQLEFIKKVIDRCDYYVVIVGARYGSLDDDKSFTEKEYEYAVSRNIPVLAFLHKDPGKIPAEKTDTDPAQKSRLENFRTRLRTSRIVQFWTDANDLCMNVVVSANNATMLQPGHGWVRGDQAIDPKVLQEAERLRIENAGLKEQLARINGEQLVFDPNLLGPDDKLVLKLMINGQEQTREVGIGQMFVALYDALLPEPYQRIIRFAIARAALSSSDTLNPKNEINCHDDSVALLRNQLEALGLILPFSRDSGDGHYSTAWSLTDKGRRYYAEQKAIRKQVAP